MKLPIFYTIREIASLSGSLNSNYPEIEFGPLHYHQFEIDKTKASFPLGDAIFFARSDMLLSILTRFLISSNHKIDKTKEKIASGGKSHQVENCLKGPFTRAIFVAIFLILTHAIEWLSHKSIDLYSFAQMV